MKKLIIPDTQVKPGVPTDHMEWIGKYILDQKPDCVIHLGDHYDMHSLSSYDQGKKAGEGARFNEDIDAGNAALARLMGPIANYNKKRRMFKEKQYKPRYVALIGNHEQRIERYVNDHPELDGALDYSWFDWGKWGWEVHDFLEIVNIAGVRYSHYFANPGTGRPYSGMMETRLKNVGFPFTQGHQQGLKTGMRELGDGTVHRGLVAGSCYLHTESYRGPQGAFEWRGVLVKHECANGDYDLMEVSLNYLCRKYEGIPLDEFMMKKHNTPWNRR